MSYRLLVSTSPSEDLAQSDEDALLGRAKPNAREYREEDGPLKEGESLALQVELTLGSSTCACCFPRLCSCLDLRALTKREVGRTDATMALREVLKSRTSAANQKSLTQAMEARLDQGKAEDQGQGQAMDVEVAGPAEGEVKTA